MIPNLEIPIAGGLNVALPKMALVRQRFDDSRLDDVGQAVGEQMQRSEIRDRVRPGMKIAIGAGSLHSTVQRLTHRPPRLKR